MAAPKCNLAHHAWAPTRSTLRALRAWAALQAIPKNHLGVPSRSRLPLGSARPLRLHLRPGRIREGILAPGIISINIPSFVQDSNAVSHVYTNQYK
jgi:hypothetical protein